MGQIKIVSGESNVPDNALRQGCLGPPSPPVGLPKVVSECSLWWMVESHPQTVTKETQPVLVNYSGETFLSCSLVEEVVRNCLWPLDSKDGSKLATVEG